MHSDSLVIGGRDVHGIGVVLGPGVDVGRGHDRRPAARVAVGPPRGVAVVLGGERAHGDAKGHEKNHLIMM